MKSKKIIYRNIDNAQANVDANDGYCPCKIGHIPDNKCMCKQFRDLIQNDYQGLCDCGLYEVIDQCPSKE